MAAPKRTTKPGRQALLVLGMHRAGTSALSGVLTHLGADAPRTVMPPTKDNPRGYWESVEFMKLHDQVLGSAGSRWNDWGEFNPEWIDSCLAQDLSGLLVESISKEYGRAPLFVVKDPRICRFVPLWLEALRGAKITPKVIIPIRHPLDVARSLEVRDHFGRSRSLLLWLRHVLDAEAGSRSVARTFVLYENLLDDWRAQARRIATELDLVWPKWSGDTEAKIDDYLTEELRHHAARDALIPGDGKLSEWTGTVFRILLEADEKPLDKAALAVLDGIRDEFNESSGMYAAVVREHQTRVEGLHAEMKSQLSKKTLECDGLTAKQQELLRELSAREQALAERTGEVKVLTDRVEAGVAERAEILRQHELDEARKVLLEETKALLAQSASEALNLKLSASQEALAQSERLTEEHRGIANDAVSRLQACEAELAESQRELASEKLRSSELDAQLQASKAQHSEAEEGFRARLESMAAEMSNDKRALDQAKTQLAALREQVGAESEAQRVEAAKAIEVLELSLQQRFEETAKLTQMVFSLEQSDDAWAGREREHLHEISRFADREREHLQEISRFADRERENQVEARENLRQIALLEYDKSLMQAERQSLLVAMARQESTTIGERLIRRFAPTQPGRLLRLGRDSTSDAEVVPVSAEFDRNVEVLRSSTFFEADWYLAQYPDVGEQEADPVHHYLLHGAREGRNPGPSFDTVGYLIRYEDVRHSALNPLVHYLEYGQEEGREATPATVEH